MSQIHRRNEQEEDRIFDKICDIIMAKRTMRKKQKLDLMKRWNKIRKINLREEGRLGIKRKE